VKFVCGSWEKNVLTFLIINDWVGVGFMVWRADLCEEQAGKRLK